MAAPSLSTRLKVLLRDGMVLAPFVYDGLSARIAEAAGFGCLYLSGFGSSMAKGFPDVGLLTGTEMVENAAYVAGAVNVPVIADADTGYGNAINVQRTVRDYQRAGVAALHLEDQVFPKKCGFFKGKDVIPLEEAVAKIRAAVDARTDPDFLIIARCDALAIAGWDETEQRCRGYHAAGADMVFVDGIDSVEHLESYAQRLNDVPKLYNGDLRPSADIAAMGFQVMIHRGPMFHAFRALRAAYRGLKAEGRLDPAVFGDTAELRMEIAETLGLERIYEAEERYAAHPAG